jgi:hypothetical protein
MTRPPQLARKRLPFGACGSFCGIEVIGCSNPGVKFGAAKHRLGRGEPE